MLNIKGTIFVILSQALYVLTSYTSGNDFETQQAFAMIFCENILTCHNSTGTEGLDRIRQCVKDKSPEFKTMTETDNKLTPKECLIAMETDVIYLMTDIKENATNYLDCLMEFENVQGYMESCTLTDLGVINEVSGGDLNPQLNILTSAFCVNLSTLECNRTEPIEALKAIRNCTKSSENFKQFYENNENLELNDCKRNYYESFLNSMANGTGLNWQSLFETCKKGDTGDSDIDDPSIHCKNFLNND